jgi:crotonobetainyl-CoA:carnitine CoA-transferase CaiB-like acyl-CoA transferase
MTPLAGIRVVEAASFISGPLASMTLADLGADVIKVESITGDPIHNFYRPN